MSEPPGADLGRCHDCGVVERIVEKIGGLADDPRPKGSEKLAGYDDRYRVCQGYYRIVYMIDDKAMEVTIYKVGHRKDVYR